MRAGLALFAVGALESGFAADASVRQKILKVDKAGLTDATVQLDDNYRQGVVDIIRWTHQQGRKFMFIVSPNESPDTFNSDTVAITRFLEDQDAAPDIYGVTLYGKRPLHLVPESEPGPGGKPVAASTLTGSAYYLLKHARADGGELDLWAEASGKHVGRSERQEDAANATVVR